MGCTEDICYHCRIIIAQNIVYSVWENELQSFGKTRWMCDSQLESDEAETKVIKVVNTVTYTLLPYNYFIMKII